MHHRTNRRRTAAGLASMALGAAAVVAGLAAPAAAHDGEREPWKPPYTNATCADLATAVGLDDVWTQSKIDSGAVPGPGETERYELVESEGLTRGYTGDGPWVEIVMNDEQNNFSWTSSEGIDAIYVKGGHGSTFYGYQPETGGTDNYEDLEILGPGEEITEDIDLGTLPWGRGPEISHITFCWDDEGSETPPDTPPSSECPDVSVSGGMPEENPPYGETPGDDECDTPPSTPPPSTPPSSDTPTTSTTLDIETGSSTTLLENSPAPGETTTTVEGTPEDSPDGTLPNTGSNSTTPLILGGLVLLVVGGGLVAGMRFLRRA